MEYIAVNPIRIAELIRNKITPDLNKVLPGIKVLSAGLRDDNGLPGFPIDLMGCFGQCNLAKEAGKAVAKLSEGDVANKISDIVAYYNRLVLDLEKFSNGLRSGDIKLGEQSLGTQENLVGAGFNSATASIMAKMVHDAITLAYQDGSPNLFCRMSGEPQLTRIQVERELRLKK